jgi:hypothetical protein
LSSTTSPTLRDRVPWHVAWLVTRLVAPLVVDFSASCRLVDDYSASRRLVVASPPPRFRVPDMLRGSSSTTPPRAGSSSTTSPPPCVRVPRHVKRLVAPLVVDFSASRRLVVDYSARLVVDYFAYAARLGASACHTAHLLSSTTSPTPRDRVPRHVERFIACRRLLRLRCATGCLGTSRGSSCGSLHRSSSTTSPMSRVRMPRRVTRPVTRLIVDYSARCDFVLRPRWLYFSHAVRRDYLSRGNTGSTSSTSRAATTSSSGRIASTIHLD